MDNDRVTTCWDDPALAPYFRGAPELIRLLAGPEWNHGRVGASDVTARLIARACFTAEETPADHRPISP